MTPDDKPKEILGADGDPQRQIADLQQKTAALESELDWRRREERFRLFVEAVQDYAIFMLDPQGNVSSWNTGAERLKGYKASEIIGKHFSRFYPEQEIRSGRPSMELEAAARDGRFEDEGWRVRNDGSRFWANVIITAVRDEHGTLLGFGKVTRDFTDRMQAQQALDTANRELKNEIIERIVTEKKLADSERALRLLSLHLLRTQDEERRRIGRDLHDSLGQILSAIKINLDILASRTGNPEIAGITKLADECIKEVRTISYLLYPPMLEDLGLPSAVPWYLEGFSNRSGIRTTFEISPGFGRLSREAELAMFRVLQEGLTNVHRHSESSVAHVQLTINDGLAILSISDKGKGIPETILSNSGTDRLHATGVGLRGMNERLLQIGGRLEVASGRDGTTVAAIVPSTAGAAPDKNEAAA